MNLGKNQYLKINLSLRLLRLEVFNEAENLQTWYPHNKISFEGLVIKMFMQ